MITSWSPKTIAVVFLAFFLFAVAGGGVFANAVKAQDAGQTEILVDQETDTVRIMIDGKEILTVDKDGLRVKGNIEYLGTITDTGGAGNAP